MCTTFLLYWVRSSPAKGCGINLGILVATRGEFSCNQRVSKDRVGQAIVAHHPIIRGVSSIQQRMETGSDTLLGGSVYSHECSIG